jgi:cytochrome c-type biogenesis protein CcmH
MNLFSLLFGGLALALVAATVAALLRPLWRQARGTAAVMAVSVPLLAAGVYAAVGAPHMTVVARAPAGGMAGMAGPAPSRADVEAMALQMLQQLESGQGLGGSVPVAQDWVFVGQALASLQRFADAAQAFGRALALDPNNPQVLADRADALMVLQGGSAEGEPRRLVERALALDPQHAKARMLAARARAGSGTDTGSTTR